MANEMRQAKVSVRTENGKRDLFTINKDNSLQENVKAICNFFCLVSVSDSYWRFNLPAVFR